MRNVQNTTDGEAGARIPSHVRQADHAKRPGNVQAEVRLAADQLLVPPGAVRAALFAEGDNLLRETVQGGLIVVGLAGRTGKTARWKTEQKMRDNWGNRS